MSLIESPYGIVSFRQLTVMKIVDRFSVLVSGVPPHAANARVLSSDYWFGAFGEITGVRILQSNAGSDVHITFHHQSSASNAISWCNGPSSPADLSAKNGYRKYCNKFLQNKDCQRVKCHLLHHWCPFTEVLNQDKVRQLNPLKQRSHQMSPQQIPPGNDTAGWRTVTVSEAGGPMTSEMFALQKRFSDLQESFEAGKVMVNQLLFEIARAQCENSKLRRANFEIEEQSIGASSFEPFVADHYVKATGSDFNSSDGDGDGDGDGDVDVAEILDALIGVDFNSSSSPSRAFDDNAFFAPTNAPFPSYPTSS